MILGRLDARWMHLAGCWSLIGFSSSDGELMTICEAADIVAGAEGYISAECLHSMKELLIPAAFFYKVAWKLVAFPHDTKLLI